MLPLNESGITNEYWILSSFVIGIELERKVIGEWTLRICCTKKKKVLRGATERYEDACYHILGSFQSGNLV